MLLLSKKVVFKGFIVTSAVLISFGGKFHMSYR